MKRTRNLCFCIGIVLLVACEQRETATISNALFEIRMENMPGRLWSYHPADGSPRSISPPVFEIDGKEVPGLFDEMVFTSAVKAGTGVTGYRVEGGLKGLPGVVLTMEIRVSPDNPMVRFRYLLASKEPYRLTKSGGTDRLVYLRIPISENSHTREISLSQFFELPHAYLPVERAISGKEMVNGASFMGPILASSEVNQSLVITYEHGSQLPDRYLEYRFEMSGEVSLAAVKGNYTDGYPLDGGGGFETIWMNLGIATGDLQAMASYHREHVLRYMTENRASREPYIFYNTWNYQERNKNWYGNPYLHEMTLERMLKEIRVAHRMGIDVFVVDAGWFGKTGDWTASPSRFPDDLMDIKASLDSLGMQLGLWFNSDAALSSRMLSRNRDHILAMNGESRDPHPVWETEESLTMCLVSPFGDDFANELIRVARKHGVTYFKWDAFTQYGCNAPGHGHGTEMNSPEERAENYSFQLPLAMARVAGKICDSIPGAIVDFDITEGQRAVGLAFLASGKYFAVNNGPYFYSFDSPEYAPGGGMGSNVLVFPGIARAANARQVLQYDQWIPSVLFLTHYLPDDPEYSQWINLGSLILGQNGIWGDLLSMSEEGISRFGETLSLYKQVRHEITSSPPIVTGRPGSSPEIHEKIDPATGRGAVVIFYNYKNAWNRNPESAPDATFRYVTMYSPDQDVWTNPGTNVSFDEQGRAVIESPFHGTRGEDYFLWCVSLIRGYPCTPGPILQKTWWPTVQGPYKTGFRLHLWCSRQRVRTVRSRHRSCGRLRILSLHYP